LTSQPSSGEGGDAAACEECGFASTDGPVWAHEGALLFSSPHTNVIYRWSAVGTVEVFRAKSGYAGVDIGRFARPGSTGLTFDPHGRLVICQHGNRRVIRVEPHGNVSVLADRFEGRRLNSPDDVVVRSDGAVFFTDPPSGLPGTAFRHGRLILGMREELVGAIIFGVASFTDSNALMTNKHPRSAIHGIFPNRLLPSGTAGADL